MHLYNVSYRNALHSRLFLEMKGAPFPSTAIMFAKVVFPVPGVPVTKMFGNLPIVAVQETKEWLIPYGTNNALKR